MSPWRRLIVSTVIIASLGLLPGLALAESEGTLADTPLARRPAGGLPLAGTPWRLEGYRARGVERVPGPEVAAWMRLGPGTMRGSGGCRPIEGRYGRIGGAITFRLRAQQASGCAEQTNLVQRAMVDGLRKAASFELVPAADPLMDRLVLRSATGVELLRFGLDDIGELDQADWRLTSYTIEGRSMAASPDQPAILAFQPTQNDRGRRAAAGPATGSTGCNGVVADFRSRAGVLSLSGLERTDAPCPAGLAAQETAMLSVLTAAAMTLQLRPDHLTLTSSDTGERLVFASQRPLQGTTWLARTDLGLDRQADVVTLWLQEGVARGEGPCGSYGATYATDGLFISFADVEGAGDDACSDFKSERALLSGLRAAVQVERDPSGLRLTDASGRVTLRFASPTGP